MNMSVENKWNDSKGKRQKYMEKTLSRYSTNSHTVNRTTHTVTLNPGLGVETLVTKHLIYL